MTVLPFRKPQQPIDPRWPSCAWWRSAWPEIKAAEGGRVMELADEVLAFLLGAEGDDA